MWVKLQYFWKKCFAISHAWIFTLHIIFSSPLVALKKMFLHLNNWLDRVSMTSIVSKIWLVYGQHDAACRVIARLKKERDEARSLLAQADRQIPMSASMAANAPALSNGKRGSLFMCFLVYFHIYFLILIYL